jgi:hypothetical protein
MQAVTANHAESSSFVWAGYACASCGMGVLAGASLRPNHAQTLTPWDAPHAQLASAGIFPSPRVLSNDIPDTARRYLEQAWDSLHAPDGAVMLAASSVDAMLKAKQLRNGSLYSRVNEARDSHLITPDIADWAHEIRLDANEVRHADTAQPHHDVASATRVLDFATALADVLFVLPARVQRGRNS